MKKLISMLLVIASILVIVSACAKENGKKGPSGSNNPGEKEWLDNLPVDLDLEGAEIKFVTSESDGGVLSARSVAVEEDDGDIVNSAIYNRNTRLEERLNCTITLVEALPGGIQSSVTPSLMAGDDDYDVLGGRQHDDIDLCLDGYCLNLSDLAEYGGDYIEVDQPWWGTEYIDRMTYKDHLYWLTGVLSLRYVSGANCMFVNAELYNKYVSEKHGDLYEIVKAGDWTLDLMGEMASLSYVDENGNDRSDEEDTFGFFVHNGSDVPDAFAYSYGVRYSYEDADGTIVFNLTDTNSLYVDFINKMSAIYLSEYSFQPSEGVRFGGGRLLFSPGRVQYAETSYREVAHDFYVIPLPKKDAASEYTTTIHDGNLMFAISYCTPQVAQTAAVLEAMAAESYRSVMPAYYDLALKYKYTRDDNAAEMIDIIRDSITTDFALIWAGTLGCLKFTRTHLKESAITSDLKKAQVAWITSFNRLIEDFGEIQTAVPKT